MNPSTLSETQIIQGVYQRNPAIFQLLYQQFTPIILAYVLKNSGTRADGLEVVQKTILSFWEAVKNGQYQEQNKLKSFIFSLAANTWRMELRRRKRHPERELGELETLLEDDSQTDLFSKLMKNNAIDAIYQGLKKLGQTCQELIELYHFEEIPLKTIAEQKGYNYGNLRKRIFDCRNQLKKIAEMEMQVLRNAK